MSLTTPYVNITSRILTIVAALSVSADTFVFIIAMKVSKLKHIGRVVTLSANFSTFA